MLAASCLHVHAGNYLCHKMCSYFLMDIYILLTVFLGSPAERVTTCEECMPHRLSCGIYLYLDFKVTLLLSFLMKCVLIFLVCLTLTEPDGVISVQSSMYGRADRVTCSEGKSPNVVINTHCSLVGAVDQVKKR